jgi:hypothetical protein
MIIRTMACHDQSLVDSLYEPDVDLLLQNNLLLYNRYKLKINEIINFDIKLYIIWTSIALCS